MREYNKEEYQNKMETVYGKKVVEYFGKFRMEKEEKGFPENYEEFEVRMKSYVFRIGDPDTNIAEDKSEKKVSNFYTHKYFTKFILISIEKLNQYSNVDLSEENRNNWQLEHILPQKNGGKYENCYIRCLGNLTLLSKGLNVKSNNLSYEEKRKLFWDWEGEGEGKGEERRFHINKLYRRKTFEEQDVEKRFKRLKNKFLKIFSANKSRENFTLDKFEKIIGL